MIDPGRVLVMGLNTKTLAKLSLYINGGFFPLGVFSFIKFSFFIAVCTKLNAIHELQYVCSKRFT